MLSKLKLHSTLSEPTIIYDILLYNPVWKIIFTEVFLQRGHLLQKKLISRSNCQESKEKGIFTKAREDPIHFREGKKVHTEMQEWASLDIFTLVRQELSSNI